MNFPFFNVIKQVIKTVQNKNQADPNVKTADPSVFDNMEKQVQNTQTTSSGDFLEEMKRKVNDVQRQNEADPNVETADNSVFENMQRELEALKAKMAEQERAKTAAPTTPAPKPAAPANNQLMAMTNSGGGSLSMRTQPDMGAPTMDVRVADQSLVQVVEYSKNSIHLDGKQSRFVKVLVNGQEGWILENYLNFN